MGNEVTYFVSISILLALLGFIMPFVNEIATGETIVNDIEVIGDVTENEEDGLSLTDFTSSMLRSFFWFYGEMFLIGNIVKGVINFIWAYLLIRLIRGGG